MNPQINSLLGPLEAAARLGSWEDVQDIAGEIKRLARLETLQEAQVKQEALWSGQTTKASPASNQRIIQSFW